MSSPTPNCSCASTSPNARPGLFSQYAQGGHTFRIEDELPNTTGDIEHMLARCRGIADEAGLSALRVLAEPTGGYEQRLLKTARRLGHKTALVSPEHVAQLKKVESNDTGKTDMKDPRVIDLVARLGKAQRHRHLRGSSVIHIDLAQAAPSDELL